VKNFNEEYKPVRRPEDYFYLVVDMSLRRAELLLGSKLSHQSNGVGVLINNVAVNFQLREGGYHLKMSVADLQNDLVSLDLDSGQLQRTNVFSKIQKFRDQKYLELEVESNPVGRPNISTNINLSIKASIIVFNPELVKRLGRFSRLKINQQNRQAAIEKLGEIRSQTTANFSRSLTGDASDRKLANINVSVTAPLLIVPFEPGSNR